MGISEHLHSSPKRLNHDQIINAVIANTNATSTLMSSSLLVTMLLLLMNTEMDIGNAAGKGAKTITIMMMR
jgi:hypothetical protein